MPAGLPVGLSVLDPGTPSTQRYAYHREAELVQLQGFLGSPAAAPARGAPTTITVAVQLAGRIPFDVVI